MLVPNNDTDLKQHHQNMFLLKSACRDFHQECMLEDYIDQLEHEDEFFDEMELFLSMERYWHISQLIIQPEYTIIVDCGCGAGIQQLFFQNCKMYIGVDSAFKGRKLADNAVLLKDTVENHLSTHVYPTRLDQTVIGISVWCAANNESVHKAMIEHFERIISI